MAGGFGTGSRRSSSRSRPQGRASGPRDLLSLAASSDDEDPCAEAAALGIDTALCGNILAGLRRNPPPQYEEAKAQAAAVASRWDGGSAAVPGPRKSSARSLSRGPSEAVRAAAVLATNPDRPPRPLASRAASPNLGANVSPNLRGGGRAASPAAHHGAQATPSCGGSRGGDDTSLLSSMAARLAQVEKLNQQLSAKLANQSQEVASLRAALAAAEHDGEVGAEAGVAPRGRAAACHECAELRRQLEELKHFVSEYGLTWVPRAAADPSGAAVEGVGVLASRQPAQRKVAEADTSSVSVDINVIRARVEALNAAVEEEAPSAAKVRPNVVKTGTSQAADPLPLTFFADGVKLADHAFMPYGAKAAQELIKSILDGFPPAVLEQSHPNGVCLRVVDRTGNGFAAWFRDMSRYDPELADGGERLRPTCGRAVRDPGGAKSAGERLVSKLPERVVLKSGRVCEVKGAIAERLGVPAKPTTNNAPAIASVGKDGEVSLLDEGRDQTLPSARLMVKLEGGQRVKLCMEPHATLGHVWDALENWRSANGVARAGADGRQCVLRQAFPPRVFTNMAETLEAAQLMPSAALFVAVAEQTT